MSNSMEAFIQDCCHVDKITLDQFRQDYVALPCHCDVSQAPHWARIPLEANRICDHLAFHLPSAETLLQMSREAP